MIIIMFVQHTHRHQQILYIFIVFVTFTNYSYGYIIMSVKKQLHILFICFCLPYLTNTVKSKGI